MLHYYEIHDGNGMGHSFQFAITFRKGIRIIPRSFSKRFRRSRECKVERDKREDSYFFLFFL